MLSLDIIKVKIKNLYEINPNIFQIVKYSSGEARQHTLQYTDIYIGQTVIPEIERR